MTDIKKASSQQKRLFSSIFPSPALVHTTPTPIATPLVGFPEPGQPFGVAFESISSPSIPGHTDVQRSNAWSTATRFFTLPSHSPISCSESNCQEDIWNSKKQPSPEIDRALELISTGDATESSAECRETLVSTTSIWTAFELDHVINAYETLGRLV